MHRVLVVLAFVCLSASAVLAQDPVKVDPVHYSVVSENAEVRILKVHYGAREKSVMHVHPDLVAIFFSDAHVKFTTPDGKTQESTMKANEPLFTPAGTHLPENLSDKPMDGVLVELKCKPAK